MPIHLKPHIFQQTYSLETIQGVKKNENPSLFECVETRYKVWNTTIEISSGSLYCYGNPQ